MIPSIASQVAVFWDYGKNCRPPSNLPGSKLVESIRRVVRSSDPIKLFKAYVDVSLECANPRSATLHSDLQSSGVTLAHCPHNGKKDVADKMMIVDMLAFAIDNPPPATVVIITGDRDFAYAAAILKLRGYKITVISPSNMGHASLKAQADNWLDWLNDITRIDDSEAARTDLSVSITQSKGSSPRTTIGSGMYSVRRSSDASSLVGISKPTMSPRPESSQRVDLIEPVDSAREGESTKRDVPEPLHKKPTRQYKSDIDANLLPTPVATNFRQALYGVTSNVSNETSHRPSAALQADPEEDEDDAAQCSCKICTRPSGVLHNSFKGTSITAVDHAANAISDDTPRFFSEKDCSNVVSTSSTETPSDVSSESLSINSTSSKDTTREDDDPAKMPSTTSIIRFWPLIEFFIDQRVTTGETRFRSSRVASGMLKLRPNVYEDAGVKRMKQYTEAARLADVLAPCGLDNEGDDWIEINDTLYSDSFQRRMRYIEEVFLPLVERLRAENPTYQMQYSALGSLFKTESPGIYKRTGVKSLSQYLQKAKEEGLVCLIDLGPGLQWAELAPAFKLE